MVSYGVPPFSRKGTQLYMFIYTVYTHLRRNVKCIWKDDIKKTGDGTIYKCYNKKAMHFRAE